MTASPHQPPDPTGYAYPPPDRFSAFLTRVVDRSPRWLGPAAGTGTIAAAVGYTLLVQPATIYGAAESTCLLRLLTGFDCPGCGGTRAAWYLLHGDLAEAARHHPVFVFAVPFLLYLYVAWALRTTFGWRIPQPRVSTGAMVGLLVVWLGYSIARNLPWAPFTWLYV